MIFQLVDRNKIMCNEWEKQFNQFNDVAVYCDDFFSPKTDCVVSPANSFGFMNGGLDGIITKRLGRKVQINVQNKISQLPMKELLVGEAILVETGDADIPYCISAPTMRVPMILKHTSNAYLASKAIFHLAKLIIMHNEMKKNKINIKKITISGLGTGVGQLPYEICAKQMRMAYNEIWLGKYDTPKNLFDAQQRHQALFSDDTNNIKNL